MVSNWPVGPMTVIANPFFHEIPSHGPTPEFVRWSIGLVCPIREPIGSLGAEKTERYLWSLAAIGQCLSHGQEVEGVCIASGNDGPARGCFVDEVAAFYGGLTFCQSQCGKCPANIPFAESTSQVAGLGLAGCFGWLVRTDSLVRRLENAVQMHRDEISSLEMFRRTDPAWYGIWTADKLEGKPLDCLGRIFDALVQGENVPYEWRRLREAIVQCRVGKYPLSLEFFPAGRVAGSEWTIGPYCPECRAPVKQTIGRCEHCGRHGQGHPARRRKVLGQRPFLRLDELVGADRARKLVAQLAENQARSKSVAGGIEADHP